MSYSRTSEPIKFERDCDVVLIPQGDKLSLPAGTVGYITQALGGSFTVFVEGNLFRVAGENADAIGKIAPKQLELADIEDDDAVEKLVWSQLRTCFDPEISINVVELGLIYDCQIERLADGQRKVNIQMTLTAPACGMGDILVDDVRTKVERVPTVLEADVDLVFEPPWSRHMMSEIAQLETGMM